MTFRFETDIHPDWIDYNGHMRDSYYGLVFSLAVDTLQDEIGFNASYRAQTGCTIYLLEAHTRFLKEVKEGQRVEVVTRVLGVDAKRFHLHMEMHCAGQLAAVSEVMEMHVSQHPTPAAAPMPRSIQEILAAAILSPDQAAALPCRARSMGLNARSSGPVLG